MCQFTQIFLLHQLAVHSSRLIAALSCSGEIDFAELRKFLRKSTAVYQGTNPYKASVTRAVTTKNAASYESDEESLPSTSERQRQAAKKVTAVELSSKTDVALMSLKQSNRPGKGPPMVSDSNGLYGLIQDLVQKNSASKHAYLKQSQPSTMYVRSSVGSNQNINNFSNRAG